MQKSKFLPRGRKDRTMVLVDIRETKSAKAADIFLQVRPGKDFELITILRALIKDQKVTDAQITETGMTREVLDDLVHRMKTCKFGCMFFGTNEGSNYPKWVGIRHPGMTHYYFDLDLPRIGPDNFAV